MDPLSGPRGGHGAGGWPCHVSVAASAGVCLAEPSGRVRYANQLLCELVGLGADELDDLAVVLSRAGCADATALAGRLSAGVTDAEHYVAQLATGVLVDVDVSLVREHDGAPFLVLMQVSERIGSADNEPGAPPHAETHDPLTGLPNRKLFMERLGVALARASRTPALTAVMFI